MLGGCDHTAPLRCVHMCIMSSVIACMEKVVFCGEVNYKWGINMPACRAEPQ